MLEIDAIETGKRIRALLNEKGYSYDKTAEAIDVDTQSVYKWCRGVRNISLRNALNLALFLETDIHEFVAFKEVDEWN